MFFVIVPRVVAALQPWAEVSERLRRIALDLIGFERLSLIKVHPARSNANEFESSSEQRRSGSSLRQLC